MELNRDSRERVEQLVQALEDEQAAIEISNANQTPAPIYHEH